MQRQPDHASGLPANTAVLIRLRLIGQMEAWALNGKSVLPSGRKTRALLAVIALSAPRPVLRGRVAEMLWSRRPEEQSRASLRQEIHRLLAALEPLGGEVLAITRDHLSLRPGVVWIDVDEVLRATAARPATLGLFDGDLLEDLDGVDQAFDIWLTGERERLRDRARALGETLLRDQTDPEGVIAAAQQLLRIDRSHEQAWRALMRAYAARGDRGMAVQAYERCRAVLAEQLDAEPSAETQRLLVEVKANPAARPVPLMEVVATGASEFAEPPARAEFGRSPAPGARIGRPIGRTLPRGIAESGDQSTGPVWPHRAEARPDRLGPDRLGGDRRGGDRLNPERAGLSRLGERPFEPLAGARVAAERTTIDRPVGGGSTADFTAAEKSVDKLDDRSDATLGTSCDLVRAGVRPLQLIGLPADEAHLATGLADEITAALARFRRIFVVSSDAVARFSGHGQDEAGLRRELGLDMVLDGTVQRAPSRLRVSLRLLDLRAGNQVVWTGRFDRPADDLLTLQDEVAAEAVAQIDAEILLIERRRALARPLLGATASDLLLRALPLLARFDRPVFVQGGELLARAILLEPDHAAAHAWYAHWHMLFAGQGWADPPGECAAVAGQLADRAVMLDPQDATALTIAGHVRAVLHHRLREAMTLHERALSLNPNLAMAWNLSGMACAYRGDHAEAARRIARYKRLSPVDSQAFFFDTARIEVALLRRQHDEAAEVGREVSEMNSGFSACLKPYLSALGHLRDQEGSATIRARLIALEPDFSVAGFLAGCPFEAAADRQHFADGLRLAGVSST